MKIRLRLLNMMLLLSILLLGRTPAAQASPPEPPTTKQEAELFEAQLRNARASLASASSTSQAMAENVEFVGHIGGVTYAVAVQGNYAYVGEGPRLTILDITDPASFSVVGKTSAMPMPDIVENITIDSDYAYVAARDGGLRVVNVSDPANPTEIGAYDTPGVAWDVAISGSIAYVADGEEGLRIVDVSNPAHPTEIDFHETPGIALGVAVSGSTAYVADYEEGMRVIDVNDPTHPIEVGYYDMPGLANDVVLVGSYAYIIDAQYGDSGLRIVDVSNPVAPIEVGFYNTPGEATVSVAVADNLAYVADLLLGMWVVDVSNPSSPIQIGFYETSGAAHNIVIEGDIVYIADGDLWAVDASDPTTPVEVSSYNAMRADSIALRGKYVYVVDNDLRVVDVSIPAVPLEASFYNTPGNAMDVTVTENYAYIADGEYPDSSLRVVDARDPVKLVEMGFYNMLWTAYSLEVVETTAYIANDLDGLQVVSVEDPAAPVKVGRCSLSGNATGLAVSGDIVYVANGYNGGLRVVDVSDPVKPTEIGFYDTPGEALDVAVSDDVVYVVDGHNGGLRVVDVSDPAQPTEFGFYDTPGSATGVAVSGSIAYVADGLSGLRVVDVSDPTHPTEVGFYDTPGSAQDVAVSDGTAYVADVSGGLIILRYTGALEPEVTPVYPKENTTPSFVMQGGTVYRHLRLLKGDVTPISNATINFSTGTTALTDNNGYVTYTVAADSIGNIGTYSVTVESASYADETHVFSNPTTFDVVIEERRYAHTWEAGAVRKLYGGIDVGLVAYLGGEINGGLAFTLEESDPDSDSDDHLTFKELYAAESGMGLGADFGFPSADIEILSVEGPGAHMIGETLMREEASVQKTFTDPYQRSAREAQGVMLLLGMRDMRRGIPSQIFITDILRRANFELPFDESTMALGLHETLDMGIDGLDITIGIDSAEMNVIEVELLAVDGERTVLIGNRLSDDLVSEFYIAQLEFRVSDLSVEIWPLEELIGRYVGEYVAEVKEEIFVDRNTGQIDRVELSLTGRGNDIEFTDIDQNRVTWHYVISEDQINAEVLNSAINLSGLIRGIAKNQSSDVTIGEDPIVQEINALLRNAPVTEYQITTRDGAEVELIGEIDLEIGLKLDLGAGLEFEETRELIYEQGALLHGQAYRTSSYQADDYVVQAGKTWPELVENAVRGLWDLVVDGFGWISRQIESGIEWRIGVVAQSAGYSQGGAYIESPAGTELRAITGKEGEQVQTTSPVTVTAIGWVPEPTESNLYLNDHPASPQIAGTDFVVGGIYEFQPYTLTLAPAASLAITYTEAAASGVDEEQLGAFRWNPEGNNWQPMTAISDTSHNIFTTTVEQLGTFALGYDDTPPTVTVLSPLDGSITYNTMPWIQALISDSGAGIDPNTVEIQFNETLVTGDYITSTGQLAYIPDTPLSDGVYTITITAADVVGNQTSKSASFTVDTVRKLYLPLVLKTS